MGSKTESIKTCENNGNKRYICINCGTRADALYRDYKAGILKIEHCKFCKNVVDKYTESEPVIICLDALLLKRQAFRHLLNNSHIKGHWKLTIILLLCDAFSKSADQRQHGSHSKVMPDHVLYSALEWGLYRSYLLSLLELTVAVFMFNCCLLGLKIMDERKDRYPSPSMFTRGMLLSNFGKVLVIPAILWGNSYSDLYHTLSRLYVIAANIQAFRMMSPTQGRISSLLSGVIGHSAAAAVSLLTEKMYRGLFFT